MKFSLFLFPSYFHLFLKTITVSDLHYVYQLAIFEWVELVLISLNIKL